MSNFGPTLSEVKHIWEVFECGFHCWIFNIFWCLVLVGNSKCVTVIKHSRKSAPIGSDSHHTKTDRMPARSGHANLTIVSRSYVRVISDIASTESPFFWMDKTFKNLSLFQMRTSGKNLPVRQSDSHLGRNRRDRCWLRLEFPATSQQQINGVVNQVFVQAWDGFFLNGLAGTASEKRRLTVWKNGWNEIHQQTSISARSLWWLLPFEPVI